jgi:hypothetical protein
MKSVTKTITTTASKIIDAVNFNRQVYIHVTGNGIVYLGDSNVTSSTGFLTEKNAIPFVFNVPANETVWAVVASLTEDVRILLPDGA